MLQEWMDKLEVREGYLYKSGKHRDNTIGFKGVRKTPTGKYRGRVMVNGTEHNAGNHNCPTAAFLATVNLRRKLHGEFSNTGEHRGH